MRWRKTGTDDSGLEDRRGQSSRSGMQFPGGALGKGAGGAGIIGIIVVLLIAFLGGGSGGGFDIPSSGLDQLPTQPAATENEVANGPDPDANLKAFVAFVVRDVQDSWETSFAAAGQQYRRTVLVLFTGGVNTECGAASSAVGPFYCPADLKVYLDLTFFRELRDRFGAPGDFAQAYVIAHEFGHHVQNLLGISTEVSQEQRRDPGSANELSVRLELQADCLAGVWAHSAYQDNLLEEGDLEEGLAAAAAVGDDRLQQQAGGSIDRDSFTHGSSAQRTAWFERGFEGGEVSSCDTFSGDI
jgi:predicted metalloprotease